MRRTIVVGVGGTGLDVIRNLRRRIVEDHGRLDALPYLRFLGMDTDGREFANDAANRQKWEVLGQATGLSPAEQVILGIDEPGAILSNLEQRKDLKPWFPAQNLKGIDQTARNNPGASQIRPLGRLAFVTNTDAVRERFRATLSDIPNPPGGGRTRVFIVCSLSGGTGSGAFLDLAYSIKRWEPEVETTAMLVLPSITENRDGRYLANAYAALMELNYFSIPEIESNGRVAPVKFKLPKEAEADQSAPFDACYLVSPRNSAPLNLSLSGLADMVSHRIYLEFDGEAAAWSNAMMSNNRGERGRALCEPGSGVVHSQNFATFGISVIEYPVRKVTEVLGYLLVEDMVEGLVKGRIAPKDVPQKVKEDLVELWLDEGHLFANLDIFGNAENYPDIKTEVDRYVNEACAKAPAKGMSPVIGRRYNEFAGEFRIGGYVKFYQSKLDNCKGAVQILLGRVRDKVNKLLVDPDLGYDYALEYVSKLIETLEQVNGGYARQMTELAVKVKSAHSTVNLTLNALHEADNRIVLRGRAVAEAMQRVNGSMKVALICAVEQNAVHYANQLLGALLGGLLVKDQQVKGLRDFKAELEQWRQGVAKTLAELRTEIDSRKDYLAKRVAASADFNGSLLYSRTQVDGIYSRLDLKTATSFLRERLLPKADALTAGLAGRHLIDTGFQTALSWLSEVSAAGVADKNVADELLDHYPESRAADRHAILSANKRNAMAFLDFSQAEKGNYTNVDGVGYEDTANKVATFAAIMSDRENRFPNAALVRGELQRSVGYRSGDIQPITDKHQILFIEERAAFPLRLIKDLKTLRGEYERLVANPNALPMHIQKEFNPPLMSLFYLSDEERREMERREEEFLVAWVDNKVRRVPNDREKREEIRYLYRSGAVDKFEFLGLTRDDAFAAWMTSKTIPDAVRDSLRSDVTHIKERLDSFDARLELSKRLITSLEEIRDACKYKAEDPVYLAYSRIQERLFTHWLLPDPKSAVSA